MVYDCEGFLARKVPETTQVDPETEADNPEMAGESVHEVGAPPEFVGLTLNDELKFFT